jgi:hypothetical protein
MIKKNIRWAVSMLVLVFLLESCAHGISVYQAANGGKAKCGKNYVR